MVINLFLNIIVIFGGLIIFILGSIISIKNVLSKNQFQLVDWTLLFCAFLYGIGFPLVFVGTYFGKNNSKNEYYFTMFGAGEIIYYVLLVCTMLINIYIGWLLVKNKKLVIFKRKTVVKIDEIKCNNYNLKKLKSFSWILLVLSFVTYYVYSIPYGGFNGLLSYSTAIRAGVSDIPNKFSFFKTFSQFSLISAYIFYALTIDKNIDKKIKKGSMFGAIISGIFSLYVVISWEGRAAILNFILVYIVGAIYYKSDLFLNVFKRFIKYFPLIPFVFIALDRFFKSSGETNIFTLIISTISYPFIAFIVNFHNISYRLFQDFIYAPLYFLPSRIWRNYLGIKTSNMQTTYLVSGGFKGESIGGKMITGATPNDFLTFSFVQADIIGVIIVGIIFGAMLRFIHNGIISMKNDGLKWVLYSYCIIHFSIGVIHGADISMFITSNFAFFASVFFFPLYRKIRIFN